MQYSDELHFTNYQLFVVNCHSSEWDNWSNTKMTNMAIGKLTSDKLNLNNYLQDP